MPSPAKPLTFVFTLGAAAAAAADVTCPPDGVGVARSAMAEAIEAREPAPVAEEAVRGEDVFYFTEVTGADGRELLHRWRLNGEDPAKVRLAIGGDRWRTWSQLRGADTRPGQLVVTAELPEGCVLDRREIAIVFTRGNPAAADSQQEPAAIVAADDAAELASREAEARQLYEQGRALREAENFDAAAAALDQALALLPAEGPVMRQVSDERYYHLPLAQARASLRQKEAGALRRILPSVRRYLRDHPKRYELSPVLENYYKALYLLERR